MKNDPKQYRNCTGISCRADSTKGVERPVRIGLLRFVGSGEEVIRNMQRYVDVPEELDSTGGRAALEFCFTAVAEELQV